MHKHTPPAPNIRSLPRTLATLTRNRERHAWGDGVVRSQHGPLCCGPPSNPHADEKSVQNRDNSTQRITAPAAQAAHQTSKGSIRWANAPSNQLVWRRKCCQCHRARGSESRETRHNHLTYQKTSDRKVGGGGGWIRTNVAVTAADLQSAPFSHSGTPPPGWQRAAGIPSAPACQRKGGRHWTAA